MQTDTTTIAEQRRLDRESQRYLVAIDAADFDVMVAMWEAAQTDSALAAMMLEMHEELAAEQDRG